MTRNPKKGSLSNIIKLENIGRKNTVLKSLLKQTNTLISIESAFNQSLPSLLANQFLISSLDGTRLNLTCHSASLAMRLRFQQNDILKKLNLKLNHQQIIELHVKIRPRFRTKQRTETSRELSYDNAQLLKSEAEHTEDESLRKILLKLSKRADS